VKFYQKRRINFFKEGIGFRSLQSLITYYSGCEEMCEPHPPYPHGVTTSLNNPPAFHVICNEIDVKQPKQHRNRHVHQIYRNRSKNAELHDIIIKANTNNLVLNSDKGTQEKLTTLWMYGNNMVTPVPKLAPATRPVMLIPAPANLPTHRGVMMSTQQALPPLLSPSHTHALTAYRGYTLPYMRASSMPIIYAPPPTPGSMPGTFRTAKSSKSTEARRKRRVAQLLRSGKTDEKRKQRRKSDADVIDGNPSFQYTGLDRAIADNFLARQERSQPANRMDYTSSSGGSETYGRTDPTRSSSKTKIVCRDVVMYYNNNLQSSSSSSSFKFDLDITPSPAVRLLPISPKISAISSSLSELPKELSSYSLSLRRSQLGRSFPRFIVAVAFLRPRTSKNAELHDIIIKANTNNLVLNSDKGTQEKLTTLWMYGNNMVTPVPKLAPATRPVMLIPAPANLPTHRGVMMSTQQALPPLLSPSHTHALTAYRGYTLPYMRASSMPIIYAPPPTPGSMPGTFRTAKSSKSTEARRKRRVAQLLRSGKTDEKRKQRRKSDADVIDGNPSFQYTGLDRAIADNFLARQERSQPANRMDYTSSSGGSETYGRTDPTRSSSKTKIVCRDVVMYYNNNLQSSSSSSSFKFDLDITPSPAVRLLPISPKISAISSSLSELPKELSSYSLSLRRSQLGRSFPRFIVAVAFLRPRTTDINRFGSYKETSNFLQFSCGYGRGGVQFSWIQFDCGFCDKKFRTRSYNSSSRSELITTTALFLHRGLETLKVIESIFLFKLALIVALFHFHLGLMITGYELRQYILPIGAKAFDQGSFRSIPEY
uniref:SH2 domain-containing protein n=1 Tax=Glossina palpalis gambiensis TaxID=67801 RepID=A0A1B0AX49_9MUSC